MQYMVVGPDGNEYGPASLDTLKQWAAENRLLPTTQLRDFQTGHVMPASALTEVFPPAAAAAPTATPRDAVYSASPSIPGVRPVSASQLREDSGMGDILGAVIRSAIALVLFFVFHGLGLIVGGYGLFYAIQAQGKGHKLAPVALVISAVTLIAIGIGWFFRLGG